VVCAVPFEFVAVGISEQHPRARLADAVQGRQHRLEVPDVEDGQTQLDVRCNMQLVGTLVNIALM
jgi:hypothetical protein